MSKFPTTLALALFVLLLPAASVAQQRPTGEQISLLRRVTEAFFDRVYAGKNLELMAFFGDEMAASVDRENWMEARDTLAERAGGTARYQTHNVTMYDRNGLVAAVDFSGRVDGTPNFICGFVAWRFNGPTSIGLLRLEENLVEPEILSRMDMPRLINTLTEFRCPKSLVEDVISLSK